jgi:hypothetical protein
MECITQGFPVKSFDAVTNGVVTGTAFAMPAKAGPLQWQTLFGTAPASCNIVLEMSLDGVNWDIMDTSTAVGGEMRTFSSIGARQVRARITAISGGSTTTVIIQCN